MTFSTERTPAAWWDRLVALSQRWYITLIVCVTGLVAVLRLVPSGFPLITADVLFLAGWIGVVAGQTALQVPRISSELQSWPDTGWARWLKPVIRITFLVTMLPLTLGILCAPCVLIFPTLQNTPFTTVAAALVLIGVVPWLLGGSLFVVAVLAALIIGLPIAIIRTQARARRRRHYDYPPHLPPRH